MLKDVTMFQPARPRLMWSSEQNCRARLKGSVWLVEAVPMRPMRLVACAIAPNAVIGSSHRRAELPISGGRFRTSARKIELKQAASAVRAQAM